MLELRRKSDPLLVLFFVSGFAGLIYEAIWTHYLKLFLGHAAYAQTVVLVVFIGGLALGAAICARLAERLRNPLRIYAVVEAAIGLVSLAFHPVLVAATDWGYASLLPAACDQADTICLPQWTLSVLLLLPQSILLGATFPLVCSALLRVDNSRPGHDVAALYFSNSLGAVLGVLAAAFVLIPAVGLPGTLKVAAFANLSLALAAFAMSREAPASLDVAPIQAAGEGREPERRLLRWLLVTAFLTGLSSFIYEIVWIRMLSLVLGASTQSFELMLASFILGLAIGGAWVRNRVDAVADSVRFLAMVQLAMGVLAAGTLVFYNGTFDVMAWLMAALSRNDAGFLIFGVASTFIALAIMLPATICAGMTLPLITYRLLRSATGEKALGGVYAVNTVGAIIGVIIAVHLLLVPLGIRGALLVGAAIDVALGVGLLALIRPPGTPLRFSGSVVASVAFLVAIAVGFQIDPRRAASGVFRQGAASLAQSDQVIFHRDGKTATVDVVESANGIRAIRTNGKVDAAIAMGEGAKPTLDEFTMTMLAVLPMGYRPDARIAAVIGFGSGMSTALLLASPAIERVDTIEIEPAMIEGARHFLPHTEAAFADRRSRIVIDDAKSYFARGRERYDIIISEPSNPWVSGVSSLFTTEFYQRIAAYLNDGGVIAQWMHTYEMDSKTLASILAALSGAFPEYVVYSPTEGDLVLIARKGAAPGRFQDKVLSLPALRPVLERLKLTDARPFERRVMGHSSAIGPAFASYGMDANSDYYPVVDHRSSRSRFTREKVLDLVELQDVPVPMMEMLAGVPMPPSSSFETLYGTPADAMSDGAWRVWEVFTMPGEAHRAKRLTTPEELAAQVVRAWADCHSGLEFGQVLPSIVTMARTVNPRVGADAAARLWRDLADSPCGRKLAGTDRLWLDLMAAIAIRDTGGMLATSVPILESHRGVKDPGTELAFLAAATASACRGDEKLVGLLLSQKENWLARDAHPTPMRFIGELVGASKGRPVGVCAARSS